MRSIAVAKSFRGQLSATTNVDAVPSWLARDNHEALDGFAPYVRDNRLVSGTRTLNH
jgi:hypothetical protein